MLPLQSYVCGLIQHGDIAITYSFFLYSAHSHAFQLLGGKNSFSSVVDKALGDTDGFRRNGSSALANYRHHNLKPSSHFRYSLVFTSPASFNRGSLARLLHPFLGILYAL